MAHAVWYKILYHIVHAAIIMYENILYNYTCGRIGARKGEGARVWLGEFQYQNSSCKTYFTHNKTEHGSRPARRRKEDKCVGQPKHANRCLAGHIARCQCAYDCGQNARKAQMSAQCVLSRFADHRHDSVFSHCPPQTPFSVIKKGNGKCDGNSIEFINRSTIYVCQIN